MPKFEPKALRHVFSQFPTGVTVITTRTSEGEPIGMTASSFNTVSVEPPLILWSIDKSAHSLEAFKHCEYFAVNILSDQQIAVSNQFAGRGKDKFDGMNCTNGIAECPLLPNALAQLQCKSWNIYEGGDHLIMVGQVIDYEIVETARPLVFSQGSYAQANPHNNSFENKQIKPCDHPDFLNNHILYLLRATYNQLSHEFYERLNHHTGVSPEVWRIYACLADGQSLPLETLADLVMQPTTMLLDTLALMEKNNVQLDNNHAKLTTEGLEMAHKLLTIADQYRNELSNRVGNDYYEVMKNTLRKLY